ncbi:LRR receptor-like serine/threonine-protein kinase HSL2 [Mangifera indica]|uniref:LRR receptor-like serine/threonine-protein kinase HSL2 n=1 Tax=Mangifera indica TaxID=29780 RepID=UPI001CFB25C9|nr:LRR receptor-like serine/threonine-protein kinase HSL2 [Mangifera indica]
MAEANLIGEIPEPIGNMIALEMLDLLSNGLTGKIPNGIFMLKNLSRLFLYRNVLSAEIPQVVQSLNLTVMDLSQNSLSGTIPNDFEKLENFEGLILMYNQLSGEIPEIIGRISSLIDVRLLNNQLAGALPPDFGRYSTLTGFQVASNNLIGKLPEYLYIGENDIWSKLTENNVTGSGGSGKVYHVPVNNSGDVVAMKMIGNNSKLEQEQEKQFLAEVQTSGRIRHFNIVKLLCYISNENLKLLVYDYLENRNLDMWLHKRNRPSILAGFGSSYGSVDDFALDWPKRMQTAVGAAKGLDYMHHDCSPPIVHRDVKSSNIQLDSEFNVKIADFGPAKSLVK